ncbi:hypothetical protein L210DRAFT_2790673 [Boletus edulis BED1]|uniref:Uncharacterized protein n=1 Tax=Boletus edulis BED1 TaxID=1328754 RepID=A0AAD4C3J4_BOLED|nr:hypothetical protein L210DRAFT_2790673 [Boletus edulis BED1]
MINQRQRHFRRRLEDATSITGLMKTDSRHLLTSGSFCGVSRILEPTFKLVGFGIPGYAIALLTLTIVNELSFSAANVSHSIRCRLCRWDVLSYSRKRGTVLQSSALCSPQWVFIHPPIILAWTSWNAGEDAIYILSRTPLSARKDGFHCTDQCT